MRILSIILLIIQTVLAVYIGLQLLRILRGRYFEKKETHATANYKLSGEEISGSQPALFLIFAILIVAHNKIIPDPNWYCSVDHVGWIIGAIGITLLLLKAVVLAYGFYACIVKMKWSIRNKKPANGVLYLVGILAGILAIIGTFNEILTAGKALLLIFIVIFFLRNSILGLIFGIDPATPNETITIKDKEGRTHKLERQSGSLYSEVGSGRKWRELDKGEFVEEVDKLTIERQKLERDRMEQFEKRRQRQIRDIK